MSNWTKSPTVIFISQHFMMSSTSMKPVSVLLCMEVQDETIISVFNPILSPKVAQKSFLQK